jgi:hypothetical protein
LFIMVLFPFWSVWFKEVLSSDGWIDRQGRHARPVT